jgi:carboxynorspermidine decarboxylase
MRSELLPTPCYLVDEALIIENLKLLKGVTERTGCRILLAQKAFSMFSLYPLIGQYLDGTAASGLFEARLGAEEMGKENHVFSPAYREDEFNEIASLCSHVIFNSFSQLKRFGAPAKKAGCSIGLRINPEISTQTGPAIYDACAPGCRLGITAKNFKFELTDGVEGLHFHTLCEQNSDALVTTLNEVEKKFGHVLGKIKWLNIGGGHHITRKDYDIKTLESCLIGLSQRYKIQVYIEPGEAIALNAGFLMARVLDIVENETETAILDTSAACHMPDVLEMPYRPPLMGAFAAGQAKHTYRLAGPTCLAGDIIGDYSFDRRLNIGDRLIFEDMAIYTMVKNNTFNGMALPAIAIKDRQGNCRIIREFGYEDFKTRLS